MDLKETKKDLAEAKEQSIWWDDRVTDLAAAINDLEERMKNAQEERSWWSNRAEELQMALEDAMFEVAEINAAMADALNS